MPEVDLGIFGRQNSLLDYQRLQEEFEMKKAIAAATMRKAAMGGDLPNAVQEFNFFNQLDDEGKQQFLNVKRANNPLNLGDTFAIRDPLTNQVTPLQGGAINPKLSELPEFQAQQEAAKESAKLTQQLNIAPGIEGAKKLAELGAQQQSDRNKKAYNATNTLGLIQEAKEILPQASAGLADQLYVGGANALGKGTKQGAANARLDVIAAGLTSSVPRMEGPQSNFDVKLYEKAAGDVANKSLPVQSRLAALETIEALQIKYASQGATAESVGLADPNEVIQIPQKPANKTINWSQLP